MSQYLSEAFKKLDILNEDTFTINDNGLEDFVKFEDEDEFEDSIDVIDPEAETLDDLQDSYIGKVILDCCVCHSKIYKDVEDVVVEDDIANASEECPFCYTTDGYKVIGQVATFGEEEKEEVEETKTEEPEEVEEQELKEGIFDFGYRKRKKECDRRNAERAAQIDKEVDEKHKKWVAEWEAQQREDDARRRETQKRLDNYDDAKRRNSSNGGTGGNTGKAGIHYSGGDYYSEDLDESKSIKESVNNVNVETDEDVINVATDDNGKVTVTTESKETFVDSEEVITPVEPEVQSEINDNVEDGGEIEIDMDEFDEESFDELGEGYLKKVYENVNSFKTSNVSMIKDKLVLEGVINFTSGKSKKTNFVFGIREATKSGKVRFIGENKEIARGRKSFTVTGRVDNKKFLSESLNYNYGVKDTNGKSQRLYGTVRTKKVGK